MSDVHASRRMRLRDRCMASGTAAALVSNPANVRYLAGWSPTGAVLLLAPAEDLLVHGPHTPGEPEEGQPPEDVRCVMLTSWAADACWITVHVPTAP